MCLCETGPLVPCQTHKQQVAVFCQQKIRRATEDANQLVDRQSYILLWELLLLLLRQNGTIVGTDIAELLLKDHEILKEPIVQVKRVFFDRSMYVDAIFFHVHLIGSAGKRHGGGNGGGR